MKKLMTMLAAVGMAFGLFADVTDGSTGTSFEGTEIAAGPLAGALAKIVELPGTTGSAAELWSGLADSVKIAKYTGSDHYDESKRAWQFDANTGVETPWNNYLNLASGSDLTRYLNTSHTGHDVAEGTNNKIYFDSLVKLTAFDEVPAAEDNAKIMVWLQDSSEMTPKGGTNLWVRINGNDYDCGDAENLLDTWARVTVKALPINEEQIGFVVFVDQQLQTSVALTYTGLNLNAIAQDYANKKALFPLTAQGATTQISSVGFKGTGAIDEIVFSTTDPFDNAVDANVIKVVLNTTYAVQVSSNNEDWVNAPANFNLAQLKGGYVYFKGDDAHCNGKVDATGKKAGDVITIGNSDVPVAVATVKIGEAAAEKFAALTGDDSAIAAVNGATAAATLKLLVPVTEDISIENTAEQVVTIDLNGQNVTANDTAAIIASTDIKIVGAGTVNKNVEGENAVLSYGGDITIDSSATFNGAVSTAAEIADCEAKFDVANNSDDDKCALTPPPGKYFKVDGDYWVLDAIQKVEIPTAVENLTYNGDTQTGVAGDGVGYDLGGTYEAIDAGKYTATATLKAGYIWSDETIAAKTIDWSIAQATPEITTPPTASDDIEKNAALKTISLVGGVGSVTGTFDWTEPETKVTADGEFSVTFTPDDSKNYKTATCTVAVKVKADVPSWVPAGSEEAYKTYAATYKDIVSDLETEADKLNAFLLNAAPTKEALDAAKKAFKITSITFENGEWKVTTVDGSAYNGTIKVEAFDNPGCTGTPVDPKGAETELFYKATLGPKTAVTE